MALLLLMCSNTFASHIVGLDLFYTYLGGSNYKITLIAYGDCGPASAMAFSLLPTATPIVCVYDGASPMASVALAIEAPSAGVEITPVCPADTANTQCSSTTNPIPGIKKFVYSKTFTVPHASANWKFMFEADMGGGNIAGRAAAITNIAPATVTHLVATLNNTSVNNSNPVFTTIPTPFFCMNNSDSYNPGAVDPDGDSLSFFLVPGINGSSNCSVPGTAITYNPPFSGADPLAYTPGSFSLDQHTGQISFFPNVLQRALVVYNIEEYRAGAFVGSCQREMTFLVLTCTDIPPTGTLDGTNAGTIADSTHFEMCMNSGPFSLLVKPTEVDTMNNITVTASGLPGGAMFNVVNNNTNHPQCVFNWTSDGTPPGTYIFLSHLPRQCLPPIRSPDECLLCDHTPVADSACYRGYYIVYGWAGGALRHRSCHLLMVAQLGAFLPCLRQYVCPIG